MNTTRLRLSVIAAAIAASFPVAALGADDTTTLKQEIEQLKQELSNLRDLVQKQNQEAASKEEVKAVQTQISKVAEEQSKFTEVNSAVHLAGYGHVDFTDRKKANSSFSQVGFNPIFHYQYKDLILFETELEIMANEKGEADVGLEYANLNLFVNDYITVFGGKFLSPVGYFIQNIHPAWINKFPSKPPGFEEEGGAAPITDIGLGVRGGFPFGSTAKANYALYVGNGPRLALNGAGNGIESIVAKGGTTNPSNRKFFGGRLGILPIPGLEFGVSGGTSRVAVEPGGGAPVEANRSYDVLGGDFAYKWKGLDLRGEYIEQSVGDLATSVAPQGGTWKTWYAQAAYRIPSTNWEPVVRYGKFTSPNADQSLRQWGLGLNYWFAPSAVGKVAYEFNHGLADTINDNNRLLLQFAFGF